MSQIRVLFSIGARGGSKGFKNKNISDMHGKPLIAWSIEQALQSKYCTEVIVSTDSEDIANVATKYGAKVPFIRPAYLADDNAGKWEVWQHCVTACEEIFQLEYDIYVDLDCTSPLRDVADIDAMIEKFLSHEVDGIFTVCEARKNPYFNLVEPTPQGNLKVSKEMEQSVVRRQSAPPVFEHVASIYVLARSYLKTGTGLLSGDVIGYDIGIEKSLDLDSAFDKQLIEYLMGKKGMNSD